MSDLDSSVIEQNVEENKGSKQIKKKTKTNEGEEECEKSPTKSPDKSFKKEIAGLVKQMNQINSKLERVEGSMKGINKRLDSVMMKGDGSLNSTMKDLLVEMKADFLKSVEKSIEVLECRLFDKEKECDDLKINIQLLEKQVETQNEHTEEVKREISKNADLRKKSENEIEQYSRRNNLKISGLEDLNPRETARETAGKVIKLLKEKNVYDMSMAEIDIAHRLPNKKGNCRDVIIKFVSRYTKDDIIRNRRNLKGTGIFLNEDLTRLNFNVYMCVKRKMPDEVSQAWSKNGAIFYKSMADEIKLVKYEEFEHWLELPWQGRDRSR